MTNKLSLSPGKRLMISGRTGSGKSTLGCWFLKNSPGHWVILNPKHTKSYDGLDDVSILHRMRAADIEKSFLKHKFTVLNTGALEAEELDSIVLWLHNNYEGLGFCADELYPLHQNGRALAGLTGWLTRGRELKQSFIGMTQRPAWISKFLYSEADYIASMSLSMKEDRKKMVDATGREEFGGKVEPHHWLFYDVAGDELKHYLPVK